MTSNSSPSTPASATTWSPCSTLLLAESPAPSIQKFMVFAATRKPDLIWMPNTAYTYQRGVLFSDPTFLAQYDLYAGAADYGIAIRKDSPVRPQMERQLSIFWSQVYPGTTPSDYLVHSATWTGQKHTVPDN